MNGNSDDCHFCCSVVSMHHGFYVANHEEMSPCRCLEREFTFESQVPDKKTVEANISFVKSFLSIQSGDYDGAKKLAEKYAKTIKPEVRPGKIEAYNFLMGLICHESGDHLNAINRLKNSASDNICVKYTMGLAYDKMGNFEEAQKMLTDVASCKFANYSNTRMVKLAKNYVDAYAMRQHEFEF